MMAPNGPPGQPFTLVAATYTAFHTDGSLNLRTIERQAQDLVDHGVRGAFVCGTTGEGLSLTLDERMQVAQRWQDVAGADLDVVVHVGHTALPDSQALAAHAQQIGARAIATIGPTFFQPATVSDLVDWCAELAAAAPGLPFYYYHFPAMGSPRLSMTEFLRLGATRIPTLAGIKFTDENLLEFHACLDLADERQIMLFGRDEILLSALVLGTRGAVGSTYNLIAPLYRRVIAAFEAGDLATARAEQARARAFVELLVEFGGLPAGKAIMGLRGINCGPMRLPLRALTPETRDLLRSRLDKTDLL